jgi:hypothetical protein
MNEERNHADTPPFTCHSSTTAAFRNAPQITAFGGFPTRFQTPPTTPFRNPSATFPETPKGESRCEYQTCHRNPPRKRSDNLPDTSHEMVPLEQPNSILIRIYDGGFSLWIEPFEVRHTPVGRKPHRPLRAINCVSSAPTEFTRIYPRFVGKSTRQLEVTLSDC